MLKVIVKRMIDMVPTLFVVATVVFLITRIIPGDPAAVMLGPQASVEAVEDMREQLGLNEPIYLQFFNYILDLLRGDLGTSIYYKEHVTSLIMERFPNTVILSACALLIALGIGIPAGIVSATKQYSVYDYSLMFLSLVGVSMPIFWLGVMLVLLFSVNLGWFPATGMGSFKHLILPSITLATIPMATFARITRSSMLEVVRQDYIKTARAKGLREIIVIWKHALKNAAGPLLTVMGLQISMMLGGAVLTETIFNWPGMGRLIIDAIEKRDFMVVQGTILFIAIIFVLVNLIVDLLYMVINPRVKLVKEKGGS
ncbi:ABC transporter permease [Novibacillus thermophilus]|uniref:Glutathione ABC transporter permease GsiC n=1 Tax=Novibacillus thermophilus TaxID=1471761 RepID=A0A1U9K7X2_9BACL|nr:ABC transporter permease [Novibacillus thermophilus]AQS56167.1 glutathione ABC transporter permease GsiC [Novibacillus thermophilus]